MLYFIYILKNLKDNKLYIGYTNNINRRLKEHNKGLVSVTKYRRPFILIYFEGYRHQQDATTREKFFKTGWGEKLLEKSIKKLFFRKYSLRMRGSVG